LNESAFHFQSLTPDLIHDAITQIGLYPESGLQPLNSYENRVYLFQSEDRQRYVIKFYRPTRWTDEQIRDEHALAFYLAEHEIPVITPLKFGDHSLLNIQGYRYALWPYQPGRSIELDNNNQLYEVGMQLGRWHAASVSFPLTHRPVFSFENKVQHPIDYLETQRPWSNKNQHQWTDLLAALQSELNVDPLFHASSIALHGDCHAGNILWRDKPLFVDLDDCFLGPQIQDIWMLLSGDESEQRQQLYTILDGYEESMELDEQQYTFIEPLRTIRLLNYMVWLHQRWLDPAFQQAFPWFNQPEYWLKQQQQLEEQLKKLKTKPFSMGFNS